MRLEECFGVEEENEVWWSDSGLDEIVYFEGMFLIFGWKL